MLNSINLNAAFGLAKIQEEYLMSTKKTWKSGTDTLQHLAKSGPSSLGQQGENSTV